MQQPLSFDRDCRLTSGSKSETPPGSLPLLSRSALDPIHEGTALLLSCQLRLQVDHPPLVMDLALVGFAFTRRPMAMAKGLLGVLHCRQRLHRDEVNLPHPTVLEARRLIQGAEFVLSISPECDATALGPLSSDLKAKPWVFPPDRISRLEFDMPLLPREGGSDRETALADALTSLTQLNTLTPLGLSKLHLLLHRQAQSA